MSTQYDFVGGVSPQTSSLPAGSTKLSRHIPALDRSLPNASDAYVQPPDLDLAILKIAQVTLTPTQLKAMHTTPIALVPAQGAGTVIEVVSIHGKLVFGTAAYTGNNAMEFRQTDGSGVKLSADLPYATFVQAASGTTYGLSKSLGTAVIPVANAALVAVTPSANWAAGDSPIVLTVLYRVITP